MRGEKRRGLGMFVLTGAREHLLARERQLFLEKELPELIRRARELGIEPAVLQDAVTQQCKEKSE